MQGVIKSALQRLYEKYSAKRRAAIEALLVAREELGVQEELLAERREENAVAEAQVHLMGNQHKSIREALDNSIAEMNGEAEQASAEVSGLLEAANERARESDERMVSAQKELEATKRWETVAPTFGRNVGLRGLFVVCFVCQSTRPSFSADCVALAARASWSSRRSTAT